ncbi:amidase [Desulfofustis glycolicus]|uniref:Asp-tRNAAsn/Glu-tRNAGln amidotransferase A subunit n=1 Tax=Desulfofustis glycolicus DSM 9705 TaxID=1121409 RepID=A0A1M5XE80_9BACT|nr:amidase [Desulfofustis glycolicus]MCB2218535.1 amidase [Desulfobulbaceae bacterium]SHH98130.1 Asp-tRNAAsn/Glu-tRNAGln amidotransferase A subunit [Desulfofustis glycolicus DSM 9705]
MEPALMGAVQAAREIREGRLSSEELVRSCLARIDQLEETVQAWAFLDPELAVNQAVQADQAKRTGQRLGPLHGVPVGIKDIFDTMDMPTEDGTVLHRGRQPLSDATVVNRLRTAGAVIMGKTVTTELAVFAPAKTRNPHDPQRTPGGSSSGSAAAVAAGMVPLAIGTQTNGSMIRPASFCGVYGYKPTFGLISRHLVLQQSRPLDQVGVFARSIEDCAVLAEAIIGHDPNDPDTRLAATPHLLQIQSEEPPVTPKLALVKTPVWDRADESTRAAFAELAEALGDKVAEIDLPASFNHAHEQHRIIMEADLARSFAKEYETGREQLSGVLREMIERGQRELAVAYNNAVATIPGYNQELDKVFEWHDAIITPATVGEAPLGLDSTGSPMFCTIWTLCGMPAITLPLLVGEQGLPLGVQLVGPRGDDAALLRTARWLVEELNG